MIHVLAWALAILLMLAKYMSLAWILAIFYTYAWRVHTLSLEKGTGPAWGSAAFSFLTCLVALGLVIYG